MTSLSLRCRTSRIHWAALAGAMVLAAAPAAWAEAATTVNAFSGSLSSSVPIGVPAFRGLEPKLALRYDSSGGNGFVGLGWSLGGVSVIERASPGGGAPRFDGSDVFRLDGNPLIPCAQAAASPSCTSGGTHATRIESYAKVRYDSATSTWTIWQRDGTRTTYAARSITGRTDYRWTLASVSDPLGSSVTYGWWCDGANECYLDTVSYNGVVVKLWREGRPDALTYATGAGIARVSYRLKTIDVTVSGSRARAYKLTYTTSGAIARSLLANVQQFGKDATLDGSGAVTGGSALPACTHQYGAGAAEGTTGALASSAPATNWALTNGDGRTVQVGYADVNGDGKADAIATAWASTTTNFGARTYVALATGSGSFGPLISSAPLTSGAFTNGDGRTFDVSYADANGDGKVDVVATAWASTSTNFGVRTYVSLSNGDGTFGSLISSAPISSSWALTNGDRRTVSVGVVDVNGDGKADVIASAWASTDTNFGVRTYVSLSNGDGTFGSLISSAPVSSAWALTNGDGRTVNVSYADVNGDGKADVIASAWASTDTNFGVRTYVSLSNGDGTFGSLVSSAPISSAWALTNGDGRTVNVAAADLNGDGKADVIASAWASTSTNFGIRTYVSLSNGDGSFGPLVSSAPATNWALTNGDDRTVSVTTADLNGDGKADVVASAWAGTSTNFGVRSYVSLANGDGSFGPLISSAPISTSWALTNGDGRTLGVSAVDVTGDGKADVVASAWATTSTNFGIRVYASASADAPGALTSLANGLGGTTSATYAPTSVWSNTYLPAGTVFQTVSSVTTSDGRGDTQTTNYAYQGARWHDATTADPVREFLGFRKATTTLAATGSYSETYYWQRAGTIAKPEVIYKRKANGAIMSFDKFSFSENAAPPYTSLATQAWSFECNGDGVVDGNNNYVSGCRRVLATYAWDTYANLTTEYQYGECAAGAGECGTTGDERTAVRSFVPNTSAYVVGLPAYEELRAGIGTGGTLLGRTRFFYDGATVEATAPTQGKLTRKGVWNDQTGGYVEHSFGYDAYGNETSVTNPLGVTVTKAYDSTYHLLTVSTTNALGHVVQTGWDPVLGVPLTQTDADNNVTAHAYDVFGRGTLTTSADGSQIKVEHLDYGTVTAQRVRTSKLLPGGVWVWDDDYFDGLGRDYKKLSSTGVTQDTIYGATGKPWKKSLPYVAGETVRYDLSTYDEMGRPLTATTPENATISQSYDDGSTTVTDPSTNTRTSWFDAFQRVTRVREVIDGTTRDTSFYYDRLGRRTKSVDALGNATEATYDSLGRALQKSDPDQGRWTYAYDAMSRITRETDALGHATAIAYDALGRVTRRTYHDGTYDAFTFDEVGRGAARGRLTTSVSASGVTTRAFYDVMGRRTRYEQVIDGATYALIHAYDLAGRLSTATYPDGEVVTYGYGTSGLGTGKIVSVTGSVAGAVLKDVGYTSKGQISSLKHGNDVVTTMGFDAYGERVSSIAIGSLATLSYGYDSLGRVTSMTAPALAQSNWRYGYDSLGRLTSATNTLDGTKSETFGLDALGRRTSASKVGTYTYGDATHVHAVSMAGSNTYAYDANGNLTSGGGRGLTYGFDHRPASITYGGSTTSFVYDAQGVRAKKTGAAGTARYVGGVYENRGGVVTRYYFAGGLRVAKRDANGNQYFHTDHLGSTRLITNASGAEVQRYEYAPFGAVINQSGTRPDSHRFTGQEADDETGLLFYQARYYDPALGRFLQPDGLLPNVNSPQELDPYTYAGNSPINYVDPSGHAPVAIALVCVGAGAAAAVGLISWTVATLIIGTALTFSNNPILQTIGMVMAGWAGATVFGGPAWFGLSPGQTGALVALAQSPISPLDPTIKKAIGWAYTVTGFVSTIQNGKALNLGEGNALADSALGKKLVAWYATPGMKEVGLVRALWTSFKDGVITTAAGWVAAYLTSTWGTGGRYAVAFLGRLMVLGANGTSGILGALGATYDLAYTLKYPDGRVYDLSGGGGEEFTFYYHTGYESADFALGRQHIRVWDKNAGGYWELGDARAGFFGPGLGWGGWISTQKVTVILSPADAAAFRGALTQGAQSGGRYQGYHADSYTYISAALQFATQGTSAADLHINPGLLHW